jgi:hypothetical protein
MRPIGVIVDKASETDAESPAQMLEDPECADFLAFVGRKGDAMAEKQQRPHESGLASDRG